MRREGSAGARVVSKHLRYVEMPNLLPQYPQTPPGACSVWRRYVMPTSAHTPARERMRIVDLYTLRSMAAGGPGVVLPGRLDSPRGD
jgi:hypothetical protein